MPVSTCCKQQQSQNTFQTELFGFKCAAGLIWNENRARHGSRASTDGGTEFHAHRNVTWKQPDLWANGHRLHSKHVNTGECWAARINKGEKEQNTTANTKDVHHFMISLYAITAYTSKECVYILLLLFCEKSAAHRCTVWMCVWMGGCKTTVKCFELSSRLQKLYINTDHYIPVISLVVNLIMVVFVNMGCVI